MTIRNTSDLRLQALRVFDAILASGSMTAAAETLNMSQSAVSKQLKQLRKTFGDELFVRSGRGMAATNKALRMAPQVSSLIVQLETLQGEIEFRPSDIERDFVVATTDEVQHILLPPLVRRVAEESPRSRIIFKVLEHDYAARQLESGNVDVAITLNWHVPEHFKQKRLFGDDFVALYRKGHPLDGKTLTMKRYLAANHMMVSPLGATFGPVDEVLAAHGHQRFVSLATPYFMQVEDALCTSDLVLTLQRRTCEALVENMRLVIAELPLKIAPVQYFIFWHKRYDKDSTNQWLRQVCDDILYRPD